MEVKKWKEVTPELAALLQKLDNKSVETSFIEKHGKRLERLPAKEPTSNFSRSVSNTGFEGYRFGIIYALLKNIELERTRLALTKTEWLRFKGAINALRVNKLFFAMDCRLMVGPKPLKRMLLQQ